MPETTAYPMLDPETYNDATHRGPRATMSMSWKPNGGISGLKVAARN